MNSLFPVDLKSSNDNITGTNVTQLFPSASFASENNTTESSLSLNWLENKSFPEASFIKTKQVDEDPQIDLEERSGQSSDDNEVYNKEKNEEDYSSRKRKKKEKKKHKKKKHKHKHEYKEAKASVPVVDNTISRDHGNKTFLEEIRGLEYKDAFRIDRKADTCNWTYQSIYKGHIAKFQQNFSSCIGRRGECTVNIKDKSSKNDKHNKFRYCSRDNMKVLVSVPEMRIYPKTEEGQENRSNKISLSLPEIIVLSDKADVGSHDQQLDIREQLQDEETRLYLKGMSKSDSDKEEISDDMFHLRNKVAEFNRKTREDPHNIQLWLDFVEFQNRLKTEGPDHSDGRKMSKKYLSEKKIAIMKKAVEANPGCIELKMKYLELCQETWELEDVNKEIENLLFVHPTNMLLWKHFLLFNQSRLSRFSVSRVSKLYLRCFSVLLKYVEGSVHATQKTENLPQGILEVFCLYCNFLKQVGHKERGTALFQALIEFNVFCSYKLRDLPLLDKVAIFESFWDSGVARVGGMDAKGWKFWIENKDAKAETLQESSDENQEAEQAIIDKKLPKWQTWLEIELRRDSLHWLPWRPDLTKNETEEDCEDVDRLVLFDDISPALFTLPDHLNFELVRNFLSFLDVDVCQQSVCDLTNQTWYSAVSDMFKVSDFNIGVQKYKESKEVKTNFISRLLSQLISQFDGQLQTKLTKIQLHHQLQQYEAKSGNMKHLKKVAKLILKEPCNRNNMVVWSEYSLLLWKFGGQKDSQDVIEMALKLLSSDNRKNSEERYGVYILYRLLVLMSLGFQPEGSVNDFKKRPCLDRNATAKILHIFVCLCENRHSDIRKSQEVGPTKQLQCKRKIVSDCQLYWNHIEKGEASVDELDILLFIEATKCYSLFEYCSTPDTLDSAISVIDQALSKVENYAENKKVVIKQLHTQADTANCVQHVRKLLEELYKFKIYILTQHMTVQSLPMSRIRQTVDDVLELFPGHQDFLQIFMDIEKRSHILRRLERFFSRVIDFNSSPVIVGYAVMSQLQRLFILKSQSESDLVLQDSGLIHRLRSYFEKGLESSYSQHCPLLWRMYLHVEMMYGDSTRAQGIFYRALQQCPWSKLLFLDAVMMFGEEKLDKIVDLMTEKELRIQIPVEEVDILMEDEDAD